MFRSLRTRLVASYVSAALLLVIVAALGVTVFALSIYGTTARETIEATARAAPEEARLEVARHGSLLAAAPDIVRRLVRPGVRVTVVTLLKDQRLAVSGVLSGSKGELVLSSRSLQGGSGGAFPERPPPDNGAHPPLDNGAHPPPDNGAHPPLDNGAHPPLDNGAHPPLDNGAHPPLDSGMQRFGQGPPQDGRMPGSRGAAFPMFLNLFMRLEPQFVGIPTGRIALSPDPAQLTHFVGAFWIAFGIIGLFVVAAAWFAGRYIAEQALRPLVETTASLHRFAAGDFTPRPVVTSDRGEIGELVTAYNGAVKQVAAAFEERRSVELQMRQFVADAGHELRTPLTVIMGFIDVLRRRGTGDAVSSARIFDTMLAESRRMRGLIDKLIALARLENPQRREPEPVEVGALAQRVVDALQILQSTPRVSLRAERGLVVRGDEHELHEALANLVENALKYAPQSAVEIEAHAEGDRVVLEVSDRGPGLSPEDRQHIFDRFYRGANRGETEGFGLGLAIVKRAVERAGGEVSVESSEGSGSRFTIRLPRQPGENARIAV
jgi:signal transduction histidine kinase